MKASVEIKVRPFTVPSYVLLIAEQGEETNASVPLAAISDTDLGAMCDAFRAEVFKKAGKTDPRLK